MLSLRNKSKYAF